MSSSLKILRGFRYDPLDRLSSAGPSEGTSTQRFYQGDHLVTEREERSQRTIIRHEAQPLAQQRSMAGETETTLLATDQAHSLLRTVEQQVAYTAYGHHPGESGLSRLIGFNGESPDSITGHYLLGQGTRAFNPVLMRFNSPDELSPFGKGGFNPYAYCGNDPINFRDPTGNVRLMQFLNQHRRSVIVNPLHRLQPSSQSIVRPARPASAPTPFVYTATPIAKTEVMFKPLPPEATRKVRPYNEGKIRTGNNKRTHAIHKNLSDVAREYDEHMRLHPSTNITPDNAFLQPFLLAEEQYKKRQISSGQFAYKRHRAKQNALEKIKKASQSIRNDDMD